MLNLIRGQADAEEGTDQEETNYKIAGFTPQKRSARRRIWLRQEPISSNSSTRFHRFIPEARIQ